MNKKIFYIIIVFVFLGTYFEASALTKPDPNSDANLLSYVFYLYYDNGQIFADRDYEINYDVFSESFVSESLTTPSPYKGEIMNFKFESVKTFQFDPQKGDSNFKKGKITVKAPYAYDGQRVNFYDNSGKKLVTIFVNAAALCNNDGFCNSVEGENQKSCLADCRVAKPRQSVTPTPLPTGEGFDLNQILIYVFSGIGVGVGAWFGWRWWKKRREGNFTVPPPSNPPLPPAPPLN